jgi:hypothetical protein
MGATHSPRLSGRGWMGESRVVASRPERRVPAVFSSLPPRRLATSAVARDCVTVGAAEPADNWGTTLDFCQVTLRLARSGTLVPRRVQGADERFPGLDTELLVRGGEVGLHRLDAQEQLLSDRAVRGSGGRELTDLALTGGE